MVRAKFWVSGVEHHYMQKPEDVSASIKLHAVYGDENKSWAKHTPSGAITIQITNPEAITAFELGKQYFVDFTPAA